MSGDNFQNPNNEEIAQNEEARSAEAEPQPESWESQLHSRANELFSRRVAPLRAEIERLQAAINEISGRMLEHADAVPAEEETAGLLDFVKGWFSESSSKAEKEFQEKLEQARTEAAEEVRQRASQEFESSLLAARTEWEAEFSRSNEESVQKRLEQACADAVSVTRRESQAQIDELREQLEASRKALTLAVSSSQTANFDVLRAAVEEIDAQRTQSETLSSLVKLASQFAPRVVFFVVRGGDAVGWKASGFENGLNGDTVKLLSLPVQNPSLLHDALTTFNTAVSKSTSPGENSAVLGLYGSPAPEKSAAFPLVVRGKAAAVLYADSGTQSESSINTAAIETLMRVSSMAIELLPARRGLEPPVHPRPVETGALNAPTAAPEPSGAPAAEPEAPAAAPAEESAAPAGAETRHDLQAAEAQAETASHAEPEPEPVEQHEVPHPTSYDEESAIEAEMVESESEIEAEAQAAADTAEMEIPFIPPPPPAPPVIVEKAPVADMASAPNIPIKPRTTLDLPRESEEEAPKTAETAESYPAPPAPPASYAQQAVPTPASETEQRAHNDARRFARLLVSEIKLYNAAKVNDGRRNFDLYTRLQDEIDRSRKVYDKRVSPAVASRFDYFYDELVQTLAEGDPAKLGEGCPGPVVTAT